MQIKRTSFLLVGLVAFFVRLTSGQTRGLNIISYDIDATIPPHSDVMEVTSTCGIEKFDTISQTQLLLNSTSKLQSVQSLTKDSSFDIPFQFVGKDTLELRFPVTLSQPGPLTIKFKYAFPIGTLGDSLLLLDRGSRWYPLIADQVAKMRLRCEVPKDYTVLSAGDLRETKVSEVSSQFVWETKLPIFKLPMVVFKSNSLKMDSSEVLKKKVVLYSAVADSFSTAPIVAEAKNVFKFFTDVIGEYPYEHLTLVEVPYFDGVDVSSGLLMVGSSSLKGMGKGYFETLHLTIAEQWLGAGVFAKFRQPGFWFFTISLPHYLRLMYVRSSKGEDAFDEALHEPMKQYEKFAGKENDVPIIDVDFPNSKEKGLVLYGKGPFVINKLHNELGDHQWEALLQDLYGEFLGKILTYDEFLRHVSKHDNSGKGLKLLNKLMTQKGLPEN